MKTFINDDFLLQSDFAKRLYHTYAKDLPIIDYHCHLQPDFIADNHVFSSITELWLKGDHYKWRAMRTVGIPEQFITGNASDPEKFARWAYTVPFTVRNPLYHWTHLELQRYFGIDELLSIENATAIYEKCNNHLTTPEFTTRSLLKKVKAEVICTTDDPADSLLAHQKIKQSGLDIVVLPTFRPDKAFAIEDAKTYREYLKTLSVAADVEITNFQMLLRALERRIEYFHQAGGRLADHGLEQLYFPSQDQQFDPEQIFQNVIKGKSLTKNEIQYFKYVALRELCKLYHAKGWAQQFHLGALRNTNERMMRLLGPDSGFDSIGDFPHAFATAKFLNELDNTNQLAKTILYNLNPADNEVMATLIGNFNDGSVKGKMQFGSAWWFLDQKDGMEKQINSLSHLGLLSCFIGMLTDSRSFMSYPRHEYFRRILCNIMGNDVHQGELPADEKWLGKIVSDICYYNAKAYFNFTAAR